MNFPSYLYFGPIRGSHIWSVVPQAEGPYALQRKTLRNGAAAPWAVPPARALTERTKAWIPPALLSEHHLQSDISGTLVAYRGSKFLQDYPKRDRKSTRLNSSHVAMSYAVFCL